MTDDGRTLVLFHTMDPRGEKLGGIETHVRLVLAKHPQTLSVLFVGIDEIGDLTPGRVVSMTYEERRFDFLPVARVPTETINAAAKSIMQSTTLRFVLGALRHLGAIRRAISGRSASCEIERFEFAVLPRLLRRSAVLIVHNEGTKADKMDSLLKRYWFLHLFNERLALRLATRIFAVNASIAQRIASIDPALSERTNVMSVSVDTERFRPSPFAEHDDAFRVCFAGRLDDFKDPPLMFSALAAFATQLEQKPVGRFRCVRFDYVGASDPGRFPEFAAIARSTLRHGRKSAAAVADIMRGAHAGIITSFFEGMPCYLLEMLASGRPVAAVRLAQFDPLIIEKTSGALVARDPSPAKSAEVVANALYSLAEDIEGGHLEPDRIASLIAPYAVTAQMGRLFDCHLAMSEPRQARSSASFA